MNEGCSQMLKAWIEAGKDLGIEVIHSNDLTNLGLAFPCVALIKNFGSPQGTLVLPLHAPENAVRSAENKGYYVSWLNVDGYGMYDRQLFVDTLDDWGYFGSERPAWYTGKNWT